MKVHKKLAGKAHTIGDLKEFIQRAEEEGFDDDTLINPKTAQSTLAGEMRQALEPDGISIFLDEVKGELSFTKATLPYVGTCPECGNDYAVALNKLLPEHYRGEGTTSHSRCYGVGKLARKLREVS